MKDARLGRVTKAATPIANPLILVLCFERMFCPNWVGGTPESWLGMQQAVDLWDAGIKLQSNPVLGPLLRRASLAV